MTDRAATKAIIKRASQKAREVMNQLDADTLDQLTTLYRQLVEGINLEIDNFADADGAIQLESLRALLTASEAKLLQLEAQRNALLATSMQAAALLGVEPFAVDAAILTQTTTVSANQAVKFVENFIAEDGLQLSDRIWRLDNQAAQIVRDAINQAVIQGHSASRAAQDLLSNGQAVSATLRAKLNDNKAGGIKQRIEQELLAGTGTPYANALRVMRTELNRAHGEAYLSTAFSHPDVIGTRFLLSPNHPRRDICDMHAHANLYGLGKGVYPKGKSPWPAHPNTLSYTEVVFKDEVTTQDRQGKQSPIDWLNDQSATAQAEVLNSNKKQIALEKGLLPANAIATPWRDLKPRLEKQGHNTDTWGNA